MKGPVISRAHYLPTYSVFFFEPSQFCVWEPLPGVCYLQGRRPLRNKQTQEITNVLVSTEAMRVLGGPERLAAVDVVFHVVPFLSME